MNGNAIRLFIHISHHFLYSHDYLGQESYIADQRYDTGVAESRTYNIPCFRAAIFTLYTKVVAGFKTSSKAG